MNNRPCLKCKKSFKAISDFNRICGKCSSKPSTPDYPTISNDGRVLRKKTDLSKAGHKE